MKRIVFYSLVAILCSLLFPLSTQAQETVMHIKGNVKLFNKTDNSIIKSPERLWYGLFVNHETALKVQKEVKRISEISDRIEREDQFRALRHREHLYSRTSAVTRSFDENVIPGMALLFITTLEYNTLIVDIRPGVIEYKDIQMDVVRVGEIVKTGLMREHVQIGSTTSDEDDGYDAFPVHITLNPDKALRNARVIVEATVVGCKTADTVGAIRRVVAQGIKFKEKKTKDKALFYESNNLIVGFDEPYKLDGKEPFVMHTLLKFRKPKGSKDFYNMPYRLIVETHKKILLDTLFEGTCLRIRPFKLLDYSPASAQIELNGEVYEEPYAQFGIRRTKLELKFRGRTDQLSNDSTNQANLKRLMKELQSYGNQLTSPVIEVSVSPDGSPAVNEKLAQKRAERVQNMIKKYLPKNATPIIKLVSNTERPHSAICRYQVQYSFIMNADECVEAWHQYKNDYMKGIRHFSPGDYYNLFSKITDSEELDELTRIAYREITQIPDYEVESKMASYIANRMALLNLREGKPNTNILAPFISYYHPKVNARQFIDETTTIVVNRKEIIANQAIMFFMENKLDSAMYMLNLLEKGGVMKKNVEMLKAIADFKRLHFTNPHLPRYEKAKQLILNASDENKAILYTELQEWYKQDEALKYVNEMNDRNPKKWYLRALLRTNKPEIDEATGLPYYLAFMQHCFDLDPSYKQFYQDEGRIDNQMRKKYPYETAKIETYRELFSRIR